MLATQSDIRKYLPQRDPIIMVGGIVEITEKTIKTIFVPGDGNMFCENGFFSEAGLVENMAQTAAAKAGYEASMQNASPPIGFIGALKNLTIERLPAANEELNTFLEITATVMNVTIVQIQVSCGEEPIAKCEMKIFLQEGINL